MMGKGLPEDDIGVERLRESGAGPTDRGNLGTAVV
jgi:hypothetical protein